MRRTLYNIFYSPSHKLFAPVNDAIALATIISVAAIVLETVPGALNVIVPSHMADAVR